MTASKEKTHTDGIWISEQREIAIIDQFCKVILAKGFVPIRQNANNFGRPYLYSQGKTFLHCRFVDSVFLEDPEAWHRPRPSIIITDNIPTKPMSSDLILALPEFWHIWHFDPVFEDRPATWSYNCFMNRCRGDRSRTFYELIRRDILQHGLVSYNVDNELYQQQHISADLHNYEKEYQIGQTLIPYNNLKGSLEQCVIDSAVSLILETYTSDDHIVFSEKLFRCLQLPRPWLLYCGPGAVEQLRVYGFDVLDNYVDHSYDRVKPHGHRLNAIINHLETFINKKYTESDYDRFRRAAQHNRSQLKKFASAWPAKFQNILDKLNQYA
jgi:hypothetical protein